MYRTLPAITETAEDLRQRMRQEHNATKRERLHRRSLLGTKHATARQAVATHLGGDREPVGHWRDASEAGGLDKLLDRYVPLERAPRVAGDALAALEKAQCNLKGFGSSDERRVWRFAQHGITISTHAVGQVVRRTFGGKPKGPRPHPKQPTRTATLSPSSRPRSPCD